SLISHSRWTGADLHTLVTEELAPYRVAGMNRISIDGPALVLDPNSAQSMAMVLHELTTNAIKYGALSVSSGKLRVEWSCSGTELLIHWSESGGPPVNVPSHQGLGTRLLGPVIQASLGGKYQLNWNFNGLQCEIVVPLDRATPNH